MLIVKILTGREFEQSVNGICGCSFSTADAIRPLTSAELSDINLTIPYGSSDRCQWLTDRCGLTLPLFIAVHRSRFSNLIFKLQFNPDEIGES